jgi:hypothetical protein
MHKALKKLSTPQLSTELQKVTQQIESIQKLINKDTGKLSLNDFKIFSDYENKQKAIKNEIRYRTIN